ncbi:MAG: aldose 1-epimerase family protein [Motilibacteraceae bacterium]
MTLDADHLDADHRPGGTLADPSHRSPLTGLDVSAFAPGSRLWPTGQQLTLVHGDQRAVVTEVGATLRGYSVGARPVVEAFPADELPAGCHGQLLAPWPNRVRDGRWAWRGRPLQLAHTQPSEDNAIHGLVRWALWEVVDESADTVSLEVVIGGQQGWPFPFRVRADYALDALGLSCTVTGENLGTGPMPWGFAAHPYLSVPGGVPAARVTVPGATRLRSDERNLPVERLAVDGPHDLREGPVLGERVLDTAYTDLRRGCALQDAADRLGLDDPVEVVVQAADGGRTHVIGDSSVRWFQVFTGDTLPAPWTRTSVAVEPMTCPPDALNSGEDLRVLEPGERARTSWRIAYEPPAASS